MQNFYPQAPGITNKAIVHPNRAFKLEVVKVFFLCVLFLLWYLTLLAATLAVACLIAYFAILLALNVGHFATGMLALGAILMGIMLIFFMLKALVIKKAEPIHTVGEVTKESEPVLFEFIERVCAETNASFPKKIFLVDDINAFVAYDSTFFSLFFPTRKNLYIGLGLVNSCTISEFKAIIGHEFGHFSQGSMRFGSYVYHFNQIIYKIISDNPEYDSLVQKWANLSNYFAVFAHMNFAIIKGVQWLMAKAHEMLNKGYMGLSRQMEFHADAVAASVSGTAPLISSLYRLELASVSYDHLLRYCNDLVKENVKADNVYTHHLKLMQLLALRESVELKDGLPMIDSSTINRMGRSRVVVKDQWASHPSTEEREAALLKLNVESESINSSAWELFNQPEILQKSITESLYASVKFEEEPQVITEEGFVEKYGEYLRLNSFQPEYKDYYNNRYITPFDVSLENYVPEDLSWDELFSEEYFQIPKLIRSSEDDIALLDSIKAPGSGYKSFDFEGSRYPASDAPVISAFLRKELELNQEKLKKHDQEIFYIARRNAALHGACEELETAFLHMFAQNEEVEKDISLFTEFFVDIRKAYTQLPFSAIRELVSGILEKEKQFKLRLQELLKNEEILKLPALKHGLEVTHRFCDSSHSYFNGETYLNEELDLLNESLHAFVNISTTYFFEHKKFALECQLGMLRPESRGLREQIAL